MSACPPSRHARTTLNREPSAAFTHPRLLTFLTCLAQHGHEVSVTPLEAGHCLYITGPATPEPFTREVAHDDEDEVDTVLALRKHYRRTLVGRLYARVVNEAVPQVA